MARVDSTGVHGFSRTEYETWFRERFRAAFGADLALDSETPAGQWIGISALAMAEVDEAIVAIGNAMSVDHSAGGQLDDLGSIVNIDRGEETYSTVTATLTGVAGTVVPAGSRARTAAGEVFATTAAALLAPAGVAVEMRAIEPGPVAAAAGALSTIVSAIAGWETITNAAAAALGAAAEGDASYTERYQTRTGRLASAYLDAIAAGLIEAGATRLRLPVIENDTNVATSVAGLEIRPHSIQAIVEGGPDAAVSAAVLRLKGMGVSPMTAIVGGAHAALAGLQGYTLVSTTITGGTLAAAATLRAISDGSFQAGGIDFSGIDLSSSATYAEQAGVIQAALRASSDARFAGATVTYVLEIGLPGISRFDVTLPTGGDIGGPFEAHSAGTGSDLAAPLGLDTDGTYTAGSQPGSLGWAGETFGSIDLASATDFAGVAAAVQAAIRGSSDALISETTVAYLGGAFLIGYPWRPGDPPAVADGTLATDLGLSAALATESPGPFLRPRARALAVAATVAVQAGFPADGLNLIRAAVAARVAAYGIGERPRHNDVLIAIEGVAGAHVTDLSVTDAGEAIAGVSVPPDVYYALAPAALSITLTEI